MAAFGGPESVVTEMAGFASESVATEMAGFADCCLRLASAGTAQFSVTDLWKGLHLVKNRVDRVAVFSWTSSTSGRKKNSFVQFCRRRADSG